MYVIHEVEFFLLMSAVLPDLEKADFGRQRFQYTWLNSYFFSSLRESIKTKHT